MRLPTSPTRWPRWARRLVVAAVVVAAVVVVARLTLDPVATRLTRRGLSRTQGLRGDFAGVHVTVFGPGYTITRLKLVEDPGGDWDAPVFYAETVHVGLEWRRLFHRELVARAVIVEPKVTVLAGAAPAKPKRLETPDLSAQLQTITPLEIDRVEIRRGEFLFRDTSQPGHPELWVHRLELVARNLATRETLAHDTPATIRATGVVGKSGDLKLSVSADLFARPLAFEGRFDMVGLRASELFAFVAPKTKLQTPKGTIDLFAKFEAKGGRVSGGVKPMLENVEVLPAEPGVWDRFKAWLVGVGLEAAKDHVPGRRAVATIVPIEGRLASPDVQLWPAILGVVRNAFVEGIAAGFADLPPPVAAKKQGVVEQAKNALSKGHGPPAAQPTGAPVAPRSK